MSFSTYKRLVSVSGGSFTGAAGTAVDTSLRNLATSLQYRAYDVRAYGAAGDDSTNDTTAVQAAMDDCHSNGGGIVFFPAGTYQVTGLTWASDVQLVGIGAFQGAGQSVIKARSGTTAILNHAGTFSASDLGFRMTGIMINGNSVASVVGVKLTGLAYFDIRLCEIKNCDIGVRGDGAILGDLTHCHINSNTTYGFYAQKNSGLSIQPNQINLWSCVFLSNGTAVAHHQGAALNLWGCDLESNTLAILGSAYTGEGHGIKCDGCWFEANTTLASLINSPSTSGMALIFRDCINASGTGDQISFAAGKVLINSSTITGNTKRDTPATLYVDDISVLTITGTGTTKTITYT